MEVLTGILAHTHDDDAAAPPPRSIFDPQEEDHEDDDEDNDTAGWDDSSLADTLTTRDTRGTYESGTVATTRTTATTTTTVSPRYHNKHPSSLNEVELRIQLWDAYRLARIILGTPIKSFSLRGKTILQSIQTVAEMKLELIRLETELQLWNQTMVVVGGGGGGSSTSTSGETSTLISPTNNHQQYPPPHYRTLDDDSQDTHTETPKKANRHRSILSTSSLVDQLSMLPPPPPAVTTSTPAAVAIVSPDKDDDHDDDSTKRVTPTTPIWLSSHSTTTTNMKGIKQHYEQLQETQDQTLQDFYTQLQEIKIHIMEEQQRVLPLGDKFQVVTTTKSGPIPQEPQEEDEVSHKGSSCGPTAAGGLLRRLRRKKSSRGARTHPSTTTTTKAQDTLQAVAAVAKEHDIQTQTKEELHLRTELHKPLRESIPKQYRQKSPTQHSSLSSSSPTAIIAEERKKLLQMIEDLMKKVEISSQETQLQFHALSKQLEAHSQGRTKTTTMINPKDANVHTPAQFQQRLQTVRTLHTLELETCQSKHRQQISDLEGQLEAYQHQVKKQNSQLMKWRQKYNRLEEVLVAPEEAQEVLTELQGLSFDDDNDDNEEQEEEKALVKAKVLHILQRMTQLQNKEVKEEKLRNQTRQLAQAKEASSQSELEDLRLQHQLLKEDTEVSPEEWEKQLGKQRRAFEREMKELFRREEQRLREMEVLEVQLTDLAFLAVEVEDLEQTCRETNEQYSQILGKAKQRLASTNPMIKALQAKTQQVRLSQRDVLQDLETAWASTSTGDELSPQLVTTLQTKLRNHDDANANSTEWLLARRNEELKTTQAQLAERDSRIQELERQIREMQGVAAS